QLHRRPRGRDSRGVDPRQGHDGDRDVASRRPRMTHTQRIIVLIALLFLSGFFSGSETALFSLSRAKRQKLAAGNDGTSRLILRLLGKPRRLIATILVGNELVNISSGAVAARLGEDVFSRYGLLPAEIITTLCLLPIILLIGEITPKSIA